jgi:hypothetical protein
MMSKETLEQRINREREEMKLAPWQFAPSEIDDGPSPYLDGAGLDSWKQAQEWRRQIRETNPKYFD